MPSQQLYWKRRSGTGRRTSLHFFTQVNLTYHDICHDSRHTSQYSLLLYMQVAYRLPIGVFEGWVAVVRCLPWADLPLLLFMPIIYHRQGLPGGAGSAKSWRIGTSAEQSAAIFRMLNEKKEQEKEEVVKDEDEDNLKDSSSSSSSLISTANTFRNLNSLN